MPKATQVDTHSPRRLQNKPKEKKLSGKGQRAILGKEPRDWTERAKVTFLMACNSSWEKFPGTRANVSTAPCVL